VRKKRTFRGGRQFAGKEAQSAAPREKGAAIESENGKATERFADFLRGKGSLRWGGGGGCANNRGERQWSIDSGKRVPGPGRRTKGGENLFFWETKD